MMGRVVGEKRGLRRCAKGSREDGRFAVLRYFNTDGKMSAKWLNKPLTEVFTRTSQTDNTGIRDFVTF